MPTLQLTAHARPAPPLTNPFLAEYFDLTNDFNLTPTARGASAEHTLPEDEVRDKVIELTSESDVTWIGYLDDIGEAIESPEATAERVRKRSRGGAVDPGPETIRIPTALPAGGTRGRFGDILLRSLRIFGGRALGPGVDQLTEPIARALGRRVDDAACQRPGLWQVTAAGQLAALTTALPADQPYLLFVHGTVSSFEGGYGGIPAAEWEKLHARYDGRVLAFNHRTITVSPVANAVELLGVLPQGAQLDIVTHSRGGLVGDVLARFDARLDATQRDYTAHDLAAVREDFEPDELAAEAADTPPDTATRDSLIDEMQAINALAAERPLTVRRIVRVAAPAAGTELLSRRLDHYLNAAFNLLKIAAKSAPVLLPLVHVTEAFIVAVVAERADPHGFPGLYAMVPEGAYARIHNAYPHELPSTLVTIAGDSEVGGTARQTLFVLLTNLYYRAANDFVVDTASMSRGAPRRRQHFHVLLRNTAVDHFGYFAIPEHLAVVTALLTSEHPGAVALEGGLVVADLNAPLPGSRGSVADRVYDPGALLPAAYEISGRRPIVVLLPGIMGSHLHAAGKRRWIDVSALMAGALADELAFDSADVTPEALIGEFYSGFAERLAKSYDVCVFPYDWRLSLSHAAGLLSQKLTELQAHGQTIRLVAHSMGGLVVRQLMFEHRDVWEALRDRFAARVVLLGTPWRGSHLVTEVLTGHSARIRQLYRLDLRHSKRTTLETVQRFPGLLSLLPLDAPRLRDVAEWQRLARASGRGVPALREAEVTNLNALFEDIRDRLRSRRDDGADDASADPLTPADYAAITYVAGHYPETVDGYFFREKHFFGDREQLRYTTTALGDGSVTWARGIPRQLPPEQVYYVRTQHGELASDERLFAGLIDLVEEGQTREGAFAKTPPVARAGTRGARPLLPTRATVRGLPAAQGSVEALFGVRPRVEAEAEQPVLVEVFNGDLKWARFPVVVGHFETLGLVSAERAVDRYLGGVLTERYMMGFYPGRIGEQEVIVDFARRPHGAIVVGLGRKDELTGSQLALTVRRGLVKYAMFRRDNQLDEARDPAGFGHGVSMLLVGTNFGEVPLRESLRNLLAGIRAANKDIRNFSAVEGKPRLEPISRVEFVDYYEDRAYEAYRTLEDIIRREGLTDLTLADGLDEGFGRRKRFLRAAERGWWQTLTTRMETATIETPLAPPPVRLPDEDDVPDDMDKARQREIEERERRGLDVDRGRRRRYLSFETYTRGSSVNSARVDSDLQLAHLMARRMSHGDRKLNIGRVNNPLASKVLFELLIPNAYKDFLRNHRNIAWQMDAESAAFPWELFYDPATGPVPTFVRAGMVRRLYDERAPMRPAFVRQRTALVIANPSLEGITLHEELRPLPGAEAEGRLVHAKLTEKKYETVRLLAGEEVTADEAVFALFREPYKIVHIAAHGVFDRERADRTGVVLSHDFYLTPGTFRQLSDVPELVFVNCCYSGDTDAGAERRAETRYRLAANVGTQLIRLGVRAVVVAGWEVSDDAAELWARVFYDEMLAGAYFGDAVRAARQRCYRAHPSDNTWGAYQCYGDQFYRVTAEETGRRRDDDDELDLQQEIVLALDNLVSQARAIAYADREQLTGAYERATRLVARARDIGELSPQVLERKATFEYYLGDYRAAIRTYAQLFRDDSGGFELGSYFRYTNLQVRQLVIDALQAGGDTSAHYAKAIKLYQRIKKLKKINEDDEASGNGLQEGIRLLSVRASILKRMAAIANTTELALSTLKGAAELYLRAAKTAPVDDPSVIYHYCSYIQLTVLSAADASAAEQTIVDDLGEHPEAYFERWTSEVDYLGDDRDSPYATLRGANLRLTQIVWRIAAQRAAEHAAAEHAAAAEGTEDDNAAPPKALELQAEADALIRRHRRQQDGGFNLRDLRGQIEHYDLLLTLGRRLGIVKPDEAAQLRRVRTWLRGRLIFPSGQWAKEVEPPGGEDEAPRALRDGDGPGGPKGPDGGARNNGNDDSGGNGGGPMTGGGAMPHTASTDGPSRLLIKEESFTVPPASRGKRGATQKLDIPPGAELALLEIDDEDDRTHLAWTYTTDVEGASRGQQAVDILIEDGRLVIPLHLSPTRGRSKKRRIGNFFRGVKRGVVRFFRGASGFIDKELRNNYNFEVARLGSGGRITFERLGGGVAGFAEASKDQDRSLLLLHGMFNTAAGTFKDLVGKDGGAADPAFGKLLHERYGGRALVMNMPTIFRSFGHNVDQLDLAAIRSGALDIVANSRGTNVARQLSLKLGGGAGPSRGQVFLAGGPAFGTPLADGAHMLTFVNRVTTLLHGVGRLTGVAMDVLAFLLKRGAEKVLAGDGLVDMAPKSATLKQLNERWDFDAPNAYYVGSDFTPVKRFRRLIDAKLIDAQVMRGLDNDGVIPTLGTLGLRQNPANELPPNRYQLADEAACGHFDYYAHAEVVDRLVRHLRGATAAT